MTDAELRDAAVRAAMAAMGALPSVDPFVLQEEQRGGEVNAGNHGMAPEGGSSNPGRFGLSAETDSGGSSTLKFENPYYDVGGRTYKASGSSSVPADFSGIVALQISMTGTAPVASIVAFADIDALQDAQKDYSKYVLPLYQLSDGSVECDFRIGPPAVAWEFSG